MNFMPRGVRIKVHIVKGLSEVLKYLKTISNPETFMLILPKTGD